VNTGAILAGEGSPAASVTLTIGGRSTAAPESVHLLDGGAQAYPRMLLAIARAQRSVHLEVYAFAPSGVGARFVEALGQAASRGVKVQVVIDGWGSARGGRAVAAALHEVGCAARIYNRLIALFVGRFGRNHRKILLVDDEVAFLGGINIGDENVGEGVRLGWADLALEIRGPQCALLGERIRREPRRSVDSSLRIYLSGLGGGWRLRRRYLKAFASARQRVDVAHGYFLPDPGVVRAITAAARRGVQVRLLLAGRSDIPFARAATRSLYRRLLAAGVHIHEWSGSVLHAKVATIDGRRLLVGSFNLDPFSLANLEALVEVDDTPVVEQAEAWIQDHFARSRSMTSVEASSRLQRWLLDPLGRLVVRLAVTMGRVIASRRPRRVSPDHSLSSRAQAPWPGRRGGKGSAVRPPVGRGRAMSRERTSAASASLRLARKAAVAVVGLSVLGFGVALLVLPGPAVLVIPLGLAILATEFHWARKLLQRLKSRAQRVLGRPSQPAGPKVQP
jgi:cardiolipin synthase